MKNTITTYHELEHQIDMFLKGIYGCLVIESQPGKGKTHLFEEKLKGYSHYIVNGKVTPLALYGVIARFQDSLLLFDDVDQFRGESLSLLKSLCETQKVKTVSWLSSRKLPVDLPDTVHTSSRVVILTNSWQSTSIHLSALESRGIVLTFTPTNREIHNKACTFTDPDITRYLGRYLPLIPEGTLTLRMYAHLNRMKQVDIYWQPSCLDNVHLPPSEYAYALNELTCTGEDMRKAFISSTGKDGAVYDRITDQIMAGNTIPEE